MIHLTLSYIIVGITWISFVLFLVLIWFLFPNPIYYWEKVCDNCSPSSAKYRYVFRLWISEPRPPLDKTNLKIQVLKELYPLVELTFGSKQLMSNIPYSPDGRQRVCRLILYRKNPVSGITHVVMNHDGDSNFAVIRLEIQDMTETDAHIGYIDRHLKALDDGNANLTQKFPMATREPRNIEAELKPRPYPNIREVTILFFLAVNLIFLLNIYLVPCKDKFFCHEYNNGLLSSVFAGLTSSGITAILFAIVCVSYRTCVKRPMTRSQNAAKTVVQYLFLLVVVVLGAIIGILAAQWGADSSTFPKDNPEQSLPHEIYWSIANGIAFAVFFLISLPIMTIIGFCIGFYNDPDVKPRDPEAPGLRDPRSSVASDKSDGNEGDYYDSIMKGKHKVNSISQYRGVQNKTNATNPAETSVQQTAVVSKNTDPTVQQQPRTGSSAQLTTYGSSKSKTGSSHKTAQAGSSVGTATGAGSSKSKSQSKTGSSQKLPTTSGSKSKASEKDQSAKKSGSEESIGTQYYQQIMAKQGKVKSVSQYKG